MKIIKLSISLAIICLLIVCTNSCKNRSAETPEQDKKNTTIVLNEQSATDFAHQIENSLINGEPSFLNNAFDRASIKKIISANSIVASAFDTEAGQAAFDNNFKYGDFTVNTINDGGDFRFIRYYEENGKHHIVFRTYIDFGLKIDDYMLGLNEKNEIKIVDGYSYNMSATFSEIVKYDMLYYALRNTEIQSEAHLISTADSLLNAKQYKPLIRFLNEHKTELNKYPYYNYFYINALNETSTDFIRDLDQLQVEGLDERCTLLHKILFYTNKGEADKVEETIQKIINYSGEDPIYWFFYGKACANAGNYQNALRAYANSEKAMPMIWDLWKGKLYCFYQLNEKENFFQCLDLAKDTYSMTDDELNNIVRKEFPKMKR